MQIYDDDDYMSESTDRQCVRNAKRDNNENKRQRCVSDVSITAMLKERKKFFYSCSK